MYVCVCRQGDDAAPTRVIVFAPSPEAAQAAAQPIRNVLWGQHNVTVLLPQGEEPIKVRKQVLQSRLQVHSALGLHGLCLHSQVKTDLQQLGCHRAAAAHVD